MINALPESNVVVCLSGGLDSTSLLLHLLAKKCNVFAISFNYRQKHGLELDRLGANLEYLKSRGMEVPWKLIDLSTVGELLHSALIEPDWAVPTGHYQQDQMKQTVVPNRNAIFASIAFAYALSIANRNGVPVNIALGVHQGDHEIYPDCRPEFYHAIHHAFQIGNWDAEQIELYLPYLQMDKFSILRDAEQSIGKLNLDFQEVFRNTLTSYAPTADGNSHGLTGSDVERILAFDRLGVVDPIEYEKPWKVVLEQARNLEKQFRSESGSSHAAGR